MTDGTNIDFEISASAQGTREPERARTGFLERVVARVFMRPARVIKATDLSANFRLIDFQVEPSENGSWAPGDKVQVKLDGGMVTRTYTPISWNRTEGRTELLVYCHGTGPGSDWARNVTVGDSRHLFGPRSSLSLAGLMTPSIMFGDETSFALAVAIERSTQAFLPRRYIFEVNDKQESASVLQRLGLPNSVLIERRVADGHLEDVCSAVLKLQHLASAFILSGKASSIQTVTRALRASGVGTRSLRTKAYWAPGKTGLD